MVSPQIVAAISAAIAAMGESKDRFQITAVKQVGGIGYNSSTPWILSGRQDLVLARQLLLLGRKGK